jgi:hypothetical protein
MSDDATPELDEFRARYNADDNEWWRIDCGHHQNLFEAACDEVDRQEKVILRQGMTINLLTSDQIHAAVKGIREDMSVRGDGNVSPTRLGALINAAFNAYREGM